MTANQIAWSKAKEDVRHNYVSEIETGRHNLALEKLESNKLVETTRHNKASEAVEQGKLTETTRHNIATESVERGKLQETVRHNQTQESIDVGKLNETVRHNMVGESQGWAQIDETKRHNEVQEGIGLTQAQAAADQATAALFQADTSRKSQTALKEHYERQDDVANKRLEVDKQSNRIQQQMADARDYENSFLEQKYNIEQQNADTKKMDAIWSNINDSLGVLIKGVDVGVKAYTGVNSVDTFPWRS